MRWTFVLDIEVARVWIADGFDLDADKIAERVRRGLVPYARESEIKVRANVVRCPSRALVAFEQGYANERKGNVSKALPYKTRDR